jgi:NAD(P)-dependent dehydrogenase (short-subunit alcohol dehydrogenase family)
MNAAFLKGRHAVITGAGRGIGMAIAKELATLGADLTLMGRNAAPLKQLAEELRAKSAVRCETATCDVSDSDSVKRAFDATKKALGDPYVLVNNAGQAEAARFPQMSRELWDRMIAVNLTGTMLCTQEVLPAMAAARGGRIINIASTAGLKGYSTISAYCASKHGVIGLTRALAAEFVKTGVTINAVCPGYTDTDMTAAGVKKLMEAGKSAEEARHLITRTIPRGSLITPEEVAGVVAWLCSPGASAITGQSIAVSAGEVMN